MIEYVYIKGNAALDKTFVVLFPRFKTAHYIRGTPRDEIDFLKPLFFNHETL